MCVYPSDIVTTFASHSDKMGTVGVIAKNILKKIGKEEPKNGQSSILSSTSYRVSRSQPQTLTVTTFSRRILMSKNTIVYCDHKK